MTDLNRKRKAASSIVDDSSRPRPWTRQPVGCQCDSCARLNEFLLHPKRRVFRFEGFKKARSHLAASINNLSDGAGYEIRHERDLVPGTLVITKILKEESEPEPQIPITNVAKKARLAAQPDVLKEVTSSDTNRILVPYEGKSLSRKSHRAPEDAELPSKSISCLTGSDYMPRSPNGSTVQSTDKPSYSYRNYTGPRKAGIAPEDEDEQLPPASSMCLAGLTFVFTGGLIFDRGSGKELATQYGGRVVTAPSGKTDYVVVGDDPRPSKMAKIGKLGLETLDEEGFLRLIRNKGRNKP